MTDLLNKELLEELRMIMEDEFPSLMETFLEESVRQYDAAKQAWSESDMDQLRRSAHTLKGSCGNVGAEALQGACSDLEMSAAQADSQEIPNLLELVGRQLEEVNTAIRQL